MPRASPSASASRITCSITSGAFAHAVIEAFADTYVRGETPIPCIACNETVKFRDLLASRARSRRGGARRPAITCGASPAPDGPELHRAADASRDQSYFLFRTTRGAARIPALSARRDRPRTRRARSPAASTCRSRASPTARTSASCRRAPMPRMVEKLRPEAAEPGEIVDRARHRAGPPRRHRPFHRRPAQGHRHRRRRAALRHPHRARDAPRRGRPARGARHAARRRCGEVNWLGAALPAAAIRVAVKLRSAPAAGAGDAGACRR